MQDLHLEVLSIKQPLESSINGVNQELSELLFYPELSTFGHKTDKVQKQLKSLAAELLKKKNNQVFHERSVPTEYKIKSIDVVVEPAKSAQIGFKKPVTLHLPYLQWEQENNDIIVYIPALKIEVIIQNHDKLLEKIESEILFAVKRRAISKSLLEMALIQRTKADDLEVELTPWKPRPYTALEYYKVNYDDQTDQKTILKEVACQMNTGDMRQAYERTTEVTNLLECLTGKNPFSALLVGPSGVGKTAIVEEMLRSESKHLPKLWKSSGSQIVAGQTGFGMWQKRCDDMVSELAEEKSILFIGNLFELMQVGQSSSSSESIASYLRPYMMRGDLIVIAECTEEQLSALEAHDPKILDAFNRVTIAEPTPDQALNILLKVGNQYLTDASNSKHSSEEQHDLIHNIDALHRRYMSYSAYPGKPCQFLESLIKQHSDRKISRSDIVEVFSKETGLPKLILDDDIIFTPSEITEWFTQRVMAQDAGIEVVTKMLATVKTRLTRPKKPLATFMFIGPTGVGKTELAKSLAEFLYGSKERIVRFDMSEYSSPHSAQRLVSDSFSQGEGILTATVRDQPFSVILLDEFEKAAPEVYDLFLQVLGEGRLTDGAGRLADFSNAVIIMTSNLGASTFGNSNMGFLANDLEDSVLAEQHFIDAVKERVRPEFFNRIDRIVPFQALSLDSVRKIAQRELQLASKRDGLHHQGLDIQVDPEYLDQVIRNSHDPRYGARPLKRAIETHILLPVAEFIINNTKQNGTINVSADEQNQAQALVSYEPHHSSKKTYSYPQLNEAAKVRRLIYKLNHSSMLRELKSELARLERRMNQLKAKKLKQQKRRKQSLDSVFTEFDPENTPRKESLTTSLNEVTQALTKTTQWEEDLLVKSFQNSDLDAQQKHSPFTRHDALRLITEIYSVYSNLDDEIILYMQVDSLEWMTKLQQTYTTLLTGKNFKCKLGLIYRKPTKELKVKDLDEDGNEHEFITPEIVSLEEFAEMLSDKVGTRKLKPLKGIALHVQHTEAELLLRNEHGLHVYHTEDKDKQRCYISTHSGSLKKFRIPVEELEAKLDLKKIAVRREFFFEGSYRDTWLEEKGILPFSISTLDKLLNDTLLKETNNMLD
ncbi:MAG: AAA family ATPase [Akkermansiaceae bacterium]